MRAMGQLSKEEGLEIPWQHKQAPLFYNHSDLDAVNRIARRAGKTVDHFTNLKPLGGNTGENFFSDYLFDKWARNQQGNRGTNSIHCMCELCGNNPVEITGQRVVFQTVDLPSPEPIADTTVHEVTSPIVQLDDVITKYMPRTLPIPKAPTPRQLTPIAPRPAQEQPVPAVSFPVQPQILFPALQPQPQLQPNPFSITSLGFNPGPLWQGMNQPVFQHNLFHQQFALPVPIVDRNNHYCCKKYCQYMTIDKEIKGKKAGRPPHSKDCMRLKRG